MHDYTNFNKEKLSSGFAKLDQERTSPAVLRVVGVGGAGCNAIESMIARGITGVDFVAINTDAQALAKSSANHKIKIGANITRGLGAGADPNIGRKAAEESRDEISSLLAGSDMIFITCGEGGGTGTGASPVVASIAKSIGSLVIGIVTKPFNWEGKTRISNAEKGILELKQHVDSLIVIPNERILSIIEKNTPFKIALEKANEILYEATRGISDIINVPGYINVDFADVRAVMNMSGEAIMGCGIASGENRATEAAHKAISSPLLNGVSIKGSKSVLINVSGSSSMTMQEITEGNQIIFEAAGAEANIIFGVVTKEEMDDYISYTVIATGFNNRNNGSDNGFGKELNKNGKKKENSFTNTFFENLTKGEIDKTNLDTPTILRIEGNTRIDEHFNEDKLFPGFGPDFSTNKNSSKIFNKKSSNDDESSDFLRMIMD
jgi:cell division protein FtsZ